MQPSTPTPLRVLIVDPVDSSRVGLALILRRAPGIAETLVAADERQAVAVAARHIPGVAVVDVSNVGPFVGSLAEALRDAAPGIRLVLTSRCAHSAAAAMRSANAAAFVPAGSSAGAVATAVLAAARGEQVAAAPGTGGLSDREHQVLALLATGSTNAEIAAELHLSSEAIKKYASAVYRKLGVRNRTEAARRARELIG